jgi:hypothetical protein
MTQRFDQLAVDLPEPNGDPAAAAAVMTTRRSSADVPPHESELNAYICLT